MYSYQGLTTVRKLKHQMYLFQELFRLYFTSLSDEQSSLKVWVEDTFGQTVEVEFSFNNDNSEREGER